MPTPAPHTPVTFIKAGDLGQFSAECIALLAKCGYSPEDFGSHAYVQDQINTAKEKVRRWEAGEPGAQEPTARDRMLAHCTSAHLSKNGLYQHGGRGDSCGNLTPQDGQGGIGGRGGDARGYHSDLAPTMPALTGASGSSENTPGSPNERMGDSEQEQRATAIAAAQNAGRDRATVDSTTMANNAQKNAGIALSEGQTPVNPQHAAAVEARRNELTTAPAPGTVASTNPADGTDPVTPAAGGKKEFTGQTAAECVESFRKAAMDAMRQEVQARHGTAEAHAATQAQAQARVDAARERERQAQEALRNSDFDAKRQRQLQQKPKRTPKQQQELDQLNAAEARNRQLENEVRSARREREAAEQEVRNGECLRQQVQSLNGTNPPFQGVEPGWPEETQSSHGPGT